MNSLRLDGGKHSIKSGTPDDNRRVPFARLLVIDAIATLLTMSERFHQGISFVATLSIFGLSVA